MFCVNFQQSSSSSQESLDRFQVQEKSDPDRSFLLHLASRAYQKGQEQLEPAWISYPDPCMADLKRTYAAGDIGIVSVADTAG